MKFFIQKIYRSFLERVFYKINETQDKLLMINGLQSSLISKNIAHQKSIADYEFSVFSQWGEDGIISFLLDKIPVKNKVFIEFGVENYTESNTRFLLKKNNWKGLIIDGSKENIDYIHKDKIMWMHDLSAICEFITTENINTIISSFTDEEDIGLMSIDIDGNDYWVWDAIKVVEPRIVICEYNNLFGSDKELTIPYDPLFVRSEAHYSNVYYGASISALISLSKKKGYTYIGSNSAGNNAFFIRNDLIKNVDFNYDTSFVKSKFRESRDVDGKLSYLNRKEQLDLIKNMQLVDIKKNKK